MSGASFDVISFASSLNIDVKRGSSSRAWVKAAYLFIEHYVMPVIPDPLLTGTLNLKQKVTCNLLEYLAQNSNQGFPVGKVPKRKCCLSLKRLKKRHVSPVHSCIKMSDYNTKTAGNLCANCENWESIPSLLIGYLDFDQNHDLILSDQTSSVNCTMINVSSKYSQTICLLEAWNYIPLSNGCSGYIEILDGPLILAQLQPSSLSPEQPILTVTQLGQLQKSELERLQTCNITGIVHSTAIISSQQRVCLVNNVSDVNLHYSCNSCISLPDECVVVTLQQKQHFPNLLCGFQLIALNVTYKIDTGVFKSTLNFEATDESQIQINSDAKELLNMYKLNQQSPVTITSVEQPDNDSVGYKVAFCPVFIGKITYIVSSELSILSLEGGVYFVLQTSMIAGLRTGAVVCIKKVHGCKLRDITVLLCCENSQVQILEFSSVPSFYYMLRDESSSLFQQISNLNVHPLKLVTWYQLAEKMVTVAQPEHSVSQKQVKKILQQEWVFNLLFSASTKKPPSHKHLTCATKEIVQTPCEAFQHLSIQDVHRKALLMAKQLFSQMGTNVDPEQWRYCIISSEQLVDNKDIHSALGENTIFIGQLQQSTTGFLQICDGACYIPCIVIADGDNVESATSQEDQFPIQFNVPNAKHLDSLFRLCKFSIIVERRWVESLFDVECNDVDDWNPNSQENQFLYSFCLVMSAKENTIFKKSRKNETAESMDTPNTSSFQNSLGFEPPTCKYFLLFITHKSQMQEVNSRLSFCVVAFDFQSSNLLDNHLEFAGEASAWFSFIYPGTIILLELKDKSGTEDRLPKCVESCCVRQIRSVVDLPSQYSNEKVVSFYETACVKFNSSYFGQGLHKIHNIEQLIKNPPTLARNNLVSLRGVISHRILYKDRLLDASQDYSTRLDLVDNDSRLCHKMALYISPNCSASRELGLIPGTTVTFYRVKLIVSHKGHIYCKFTPTAFYIIESFKLPEPEESVAKTPIATTLKYRDSDPESTMAVDEEKVTDVTCLYDLYCNTESNVDDQPIRLKAQVTRLLSVQLTVVCAACGRQRALRCGCPLSSKVGIGSVKSYDNLEGYEVSLEAKAIITDGTGRAVLFFGQRDHPLLCTMIGIASQEWQDVIRLLRHSSSGVISYDCDFHEHRSLLTKPKPPCTEAQEVATALFDDVNTRCFFPREIVVRKQVDVKYHRFKAENASEDGQAEQIDSRFKLGTVPAECAEDIPQRTISLRLIKFNCVTVT